MSEKYSIDSNFHRCSPFEKMSIHLLSKILCFCNEIDGTCTLITCQRLYKHLCTFRVDESLIVNGIHKHGIDPMFTKELIECRAKIKSNKFRHWFREVTATDPLALLHRLNTRRAYAKNKYYQEEDLSASENFVPFQFQPLSFKRGLRRKTKYPVLLASYPRSGNSLLRTLIEKVSGVVTGSDTRPDRTLSKALSHQYDLVGEGVVNGDLVDLVKTHWPERRGYSTFKAQKVILLVRNPWDAMDSYFNMMLTNTHTKTLSESVYDKYASFYEDLVSSEITTWMHFYRGYLQLAKSERLPLLLVRYEDLLENKAKEMEKIIQFIYPQEDFKMHLRKLDEETNVSNQGSYKPRGSKRVGKSFHRYSNELINTVEKKGNPLLSRLGYDMNNMLYTSAKWEQELQDKYKNGDPESVFHVNIGKEIRCDDTYGRSLTAWRKSQTNDDQDPLETAE